LTRATHRPADTVAPPDRVGVTRKLRFGHSLIKNADGSFHIDLTKQYGSHKTAKFYGASMTPISTIVQPYLQLLVECNEFDIVGTNAYLFYCTRTCLPVSARPAPTHTHTHTHRWRGSTSV